MLLLHINFSRSNIFITITKVNGDVIFLHSAGLGTEFKNHLKSSYVSKETACNFVLDKLIKRKDKIQCIRLHYCGKNRWKRLIVKRLRKSKIKIEKMVF
jgi:ribosomal protein S11